MLHTRIVTLLLCGSVAIASSFAEAARYRRKCGTTITETEKLAVESHFASHKVDPGPIVTNATETIINVYFHVVRAGLSLERGNVPDSQLKEQMDVMNHAYAGSGIKWAHVNTSRTTNVNWFENVGPGSSEQDAMKKALRVGTAKDFNVYLVGFESRTVAGYLGYATYPWNYSGNPIDDGCVILFTTLPGGTHEPFNLGDSLAHEAGHWVGLYHTFEGGCTGVGDMVSDTPPEEEASFGCPKGRDTCAGGGVDPIHNYMDYSDDACMNQFTVGQTTRFRSQLATYRHVMF